MSTRPLPFHATFLGVVLIAIGATVVVSPSIDVVAPDNLVCRMVNVGQKSIDVHIAVIDSNTGRAAFESDVQIAPGQADLVDSDGRITGHCLFTGTFRKSDVRASLDVSSQDRTTLIVPAN
jgi:hypothetical protein